ncbi:FAD-dependent oxidoreductase [Sneathiella litorea]|uniref:NAD(P)-binding protein n=1 Tax=Sneathiella litorea TaxID=2606216 RepID=A0A6L8WBC3_9PROT|nr:NAD(P)/FAD-dependent oxidoreductase [Sneathiella litorea]MZR32526.1 NAD(P)-binding protein [Sneathiella litorea]
MTSKILIVGAGIAGLSVAQWLTRFGLDFEIIEKRSSECITPTGIVLPFNAVRELQDLNLFDKLTGQFFEAKTITYSKSSGRVIKTANLAEPPFENDQFIALKQQYLDNVLVEGLRRKIRYNTEITTIEHGDDSVKVTCTNELLNGTYDLLIAADGINSLVRQKNFEGQEINIDHNVICWRFLIPYPEHGMQPLHMIGKTDLFMAYPISADTLYCYGHVYQDLNNITLGDNAQENFKKTFSDYGGPLPGILPQVDEAEILTNRLKSVIEPCFFDRRIAFVGDASNGCSPLIQQGAATALADSRCLADALAMQNIDQALITYQKRRRKKVERVTRYADAPLAHIQNMRSWMARELRDLKIRTIGPPNVYAWKKLATDRQFLSRG